MFGHYALEKNSKFLVLENRILERSSWTVQSDSDTRTGFYCPPPPPPTYLVNRKCVSTRLVEEMHLECTEDTHRTKLCWTICQEAGAGI